VGVKYLGGFASTIGPVGGGWPAMLARAASMTPAQGADEGGTRAPLHGAPALGEEVSL
jgi:ABC-type cobalamin transport system ATPase subunit